MRWLMVLLLLIPLIAFPEIKIYVVSQPFVEVYVNGSPVGCTNALGHFYFTFSGTNLTFSMSAISPYYIQTGPAQVINISPKIQALYIPMEPAGYVRVFSNSYPVDVFANGVYVGRISGVEDKVKVPARDLELKLVSPGKNPILIRTAVAWKSTATVNVEFEEKPLSVKLIPSYEEFSPNGDWYRDDIKFHVYLSRPEDFELVIMRNDEVIRRFSRKGNEGDNVVVWNGVGKDGKIVPDGTYDVVVRVEDLESSCKIIVSKEVYTYTKEITMGILLLIVAIGVTVLLLAPEE